MRWLTIVVGGISLSVLKLKANSLAGQIETKEIRHDVVGRRFVESLVLFVWLNIWALWKGANNSMVNIIWDWITNTCDEVSWMIELSNTGRRSWWRWVCSAIRIQLACDGRRNMCLIFQKQCFIFLDITNHVFLNRNLTESTAREVSV